MPNLDLAKRAVIAPVALIAPIDTAVGSDLWIACAAAMVVAFVVGGGLIVLMSEYWSGWVAHQEVWMDKATAVHNLLFRE